MSSTVYMLRGTSGRYYIGCTDNLGLRLDQHQRGHTHSTLRLGLPLELVVDRQFASREEALKVERRLKAWKSPAKAIQYLQQSAS